MPSQDRIFDMLLHRATSSSIAGSAKIVDLMNLPD